MLLSTESWMIVNMVGSSGKGLFSRIADLQVLLVYFEDTIINFNVNYRQYQLNWSKSGRGTFPVTSNATQLPNITTRSRLGM